MSDQKAVSVLDCDLRITLLRLQTLVGPGINIIIKVT